MAGDPHVSAARPAVIAMVLVAAGVAGAIVVVRVATGPEEAPESFKYDDSRYRKTDPALVIYEETGRIATGMARPRGVAVDGAGNVLVVGDGALAVFDPRGEEIGRADLGRAPTCVAATGDGAVYVGMRDHIEAWRGSRDPVRGAAWAGLGPKANLTGIAVAGDAVFAFDAGNKAVLRFDTSGKALGRFGHEGEDRLVVYQPCGDVAALAEDLLFVTNPGRMRVDTYTLEGELSASWGKGTPEIDGFSPCCNPVSIAVLPDGSVVTAEKHLRRVKVYGSSGRLVGVVAGVERFAESKMYLDVAADAEGRVLVLDPAARAVRIFERKADGDKPDGGVE